MRGGGDIGYRPGGEDRGEGSGRSGLDASNLRTLAAAGLASCCLWARGVPVLGVSVEDLVKQHPPPPTALSTPGYVVKEQPGSALSPRAQARRLLETPPTSRTYQAGSAPAPPAVFPHQGGPIHANHSLPISQLGEEGETGPQKQ